MYETTLDIFVRAIDENNTASHDISAALYVDGNLPKKTGKSICFVSDLSILSRFQFNTVLKKIKFNTTLLFHNLRLKRRLSIE